MLITACLTANLLEDEDAVQANDLPLFLNFLLRQFTGPILDHLVEQVLEMSRSSRVLILTRILDLLVKVLMEIDFFLKDETKFVRHPL